MATAIQEEESKFLSDPDLLNVVRRLRTYMVTMDNVHYILNEIGHMDEPGVVKLAMEMLLEVPEINTKTSKILREIEASKQYREMLKQYNLNKDHD